MISLRGWKKGGTKSAHENLVTQLPLIANTFAEMRDCHCGTINLELEHGLVVEQPDHRTPPLAWHPLHSAPGEVFDILRIKLEAPLGAPALDAWLYVAHHSPHRRKPRYHEVVTRSEIPGLRDEIECRIHIDRAELRRIELPYRELRTILFV